MNRGAAGPAVMRWGVSLVLACLAMLVAGHAARAQTPAQPPVVLTLRGDETPETIANTVNALSAGGRQVEIRLAGTAPPPAPDATDKKPKSASKPAAPAKATPVGMPSTGDDMLSGQIDALLDRVVDGIDYGNRAIPSIAGLPADWQAAWQRNANGQTGLPAGWRILSIVALALAVAFLVRAACAGWFARKRVPAGPEFTPRLIASAYGLAEDMLTILLALLVVRIARNAWLPESDIASISLTTATNGAAIGAIYIAVGRFLLAPGAPERRIMPLPRADHHFRLLVLYAIATPVIVTSILLTHHVAHDPLPAAGLIALTGFAVTLFKLWWFYDMRHDLAALVLSGASSPGVVRRMVAAGAAWFYMAASILLWLVEAGAAMMTNGGRWAEAGALTQTAIVILPILVVGISSLMHCRAMHRQTTQGATPLSQAGGAALRAAAVGVIWAAGLFVLARLWAALLLGMSSDQFVVFSRQAAGVVVFAFAGWVALVFLRAFFDAYAPKRLVVGPADEEAAHDDAVPTRLATVLPVLRGVILGAVIGLTILVVLSRLGVDIGPLLAGFGILGLAFSFGSQTLVRDIVSGMFFMIEDAFRVGEYVDTGRLKGTVEKISLRSIQLRHQSGQIHTVPFGQISSLTNASRDWATVKFNVRLDHSADIEQARKAIKKTGLALLEDPEFGPHFIAPLKMQGVADITDSAIVIRLKFTAKPNQASALQREALKRVYRVLNEARIPFASNAVTVRGGDQGTQAGAAAAISTVPPPTPLAPAAG
ncbi:small-conductance mechanosensitive channel [Bosea sp. OAE752]|uniref:mechanosensitive ion channel family protein n=1 Tax=Bosea sp. OAE752 TaxID=2663873 RepID=UPI003D1C835F